MAQRKAKAKPETALAKLDTLADYRIANLGGVDIGEIIEANTGGEEFDLANLIQVTIPAGGGTTFEIDNPVTGIESTRELEGVLVYWNDRRSYWSRDLDDIGEDEDKFPDCFSANANEGVGNPGGDCRTCQFAQWDSAPGGGQACKSQRLFFFVRPADVLPMIVRAAPTSIQPSKKYLFGLAAELIPYWQIATKITLETQGSGQIKYSTLNFEAGSKLSDGDLSVLNQYRDGMLPTLESSKVNPPARRGSEDTAPVDEGELADLTSD